MRVASLSSRAPVIQFHNFGTPVSQMLSRGTFLVEIPELDEFVVRESSGKRALQLVNDSFICEVPSMPSMLLGLRLNAAKREVYRKSNKEPPENNGDQGMVLRSIEGGWKFPRIISLQEQTWKSPKKGKTELISFEAFFYNFESTLHRYLRSSTTETANGTKAVLRIALVSFEVNSKGIKALRNLFENWKGTLEVSLCIVIEMGDEKKGESGLQDEPLYVETPEKVFTIELYRQTEEMSESSEMASFDVIKGLTGLGVLKTDQLCTDIEFYPHQMTAAGIPKIFVVSAGYTGNKDKRRRGIRLIRTFLRHSGLLHPTLHVPPREDAPFPFSSLPRTFPGPAGVAGLAIDDLRNLIVQRQYNILSNDSFRVFASLCTTDVKQLAYGSWDMSENFKRFTAPLFPGKVGVTWRDLMAKVRQFRDRNQTEDD